MTGCVGIRQVVVFSATACLLLVSSLAFAQAQAGSDTDQRLKALENKMGRVLKLLELRGPASSPVDLSDKHVESLERAKEKLLAEFEKAQTDYKEFRSKVPVTKWKGAFANLPVQQLAKSQAFLQDLGQRHVEVVARTALVKNVGDNENQARALLILLQRRGVDVELLRRTGTPPRDETQTAVALVRLYGESLRLEAEELQQLTETAVNIVDADGHNISELDKFVLAEERLRNTRDQLAKLLDEITAELNKIKAIREQQKPK